MDWMVCEALFYPFQIAGANPSILSDIFGSEAGKGERGMEGEVGLVGIEL
jgi:hypothetical protein